MLEYSLFYTCTIQLSKSLKINNSEFYFFGIIFIIVTPVFESPFINA